MKPAAGLRAGTPLWRDESGNATVLAAGVLSCIVTLAGAAAISAGWVIDTHRARVAGDLAAVAGAYAHTRGADPCAQARSIAQRNGAELASCDVDGADVQVVATVDGRRGVARAGPI